ncbi:MAG: hypothetical protein AB7R55_02580 [Gemmatimonadales bacterium]
MKKYVAVAAVLFAVAACGEKQAADTPMADTAAAAAPAPATEAPAPADSTAMPDSAMASDTAHSR